MAPVGVPGEHLVTAVRREPVAGALRAGATWLDVADIVLPNPFECGGLSSVG